MSEEKSLLPQKAVVHEVLDAAGRNKVALVKVGAVGAGVVFLALSGAIIVKAALAGIALIGVGIVAAAGFTFYKLIPLFGQKLENRIWAARKAEARKNPIEQMERRYIEKNGRFKQFKEAMKLIVGQINRQTTRLETRQQQDPGQDLGMEKRMLARTQMFYQKNLDRGLKAEEKLKVFSKTIERAKWQMEFVKDGTIILQGLKAIEGADTEEELLTLESLDQVEKDFDTIFGEIEVEAVFGQAKKIEASNAAADPDFDGQN